MAEFITDKRNPLTARVMVNRIWQHLIGRGIVSTPNNFGLKAAPPSHPQLLDWLAYDFMKGDWKIKRIIRKIVLSKTYRQASTHSFESDYALQDSGNRLLWKMNRRRKDAEVLRDAMLSASGELDRSIGGPSFYPVMAAEVLEGFSRKSSAWNPSPESERKRRSIYMMTKRHLLLPLMTAFDFPNSEKPCGKRDVTTVAPQALALLNNHFVHSRSEALASKILVGSSSLKERVDQAWLHVLVLKPSDSEQKHGLSHLEQQRAHFENTSQENPELLALASLCHVLLNSNAFLYVD
ncbi:DUF1553 domain-containing protein [bacterium]|nr:DUF1553 domain-containing protein [bacterium]